MRYQLQENCLTIFLPKEVDRSSADEMRSTADLIMKTQHVKYIIFDFEKTEFMDSSGIGAIMGRYRTIHLLGGEIWAVHTNERMKKILVLSGMNNLLRIYEEETI